MNLVLNRWRQIPKVPAVYAMYGGWRPRLWVAYVGMAGDLNGRLGQHFINRDSSVTTGTAAAIINPDAVREIRWWQHESFEDRDVLAGAELVAFDVLNPALRSRGGESKKARALSARADFRQQMMNLFQGAPSGTFALPWLWDIDTRLEALERRVARLEQG